MIVAKAEEGRLIANVPEVTREVVHILRESENLYSILSDSTRLPYVECDWETCDDEILVFDDKIMAENAAKELTEEGYIVRVAALPEAQRLPFFSSLYALGVNAILLNKGGQAERVIELDAFLNRPELPKFTVEIGEKLKAGENDLKFRVENPEFHLTAIYFTQESRGKKVQEKQEEIKALHEEMMVHYREGFYLAAKSEEGGLPLLKMKDGVQLQPIFTDVQEFVKFQQMNKAKKMKTFVVTEGEVLQHIPAEAEGVIVNPFGISLVLRVKRGDTTQQA